ncbi:unnamed protein product [Camellia sinensis]
MTNPISLPLYDRVAQKNNIHQAVELITLFIFPSLLVCCLLSFKDLGLSWLLAFLCESCFTFIWLLTVSTKWNQVDYKTYPQILMQCGKPELPSADMFVTTADPILEPPILTVNTDEYEQLSQKIEDASKRDMPCQLSGSFADFANILRKNHASIIKGRVSGVMTSAAWMLNVDCDMYVDNPQMVLHVMCLFLGANNNERDTAFVQFPQIFYDGLKDDPFGNQFVVLQE